MSENGIFISKSEKIIKITIFKNKYLKITIKQKEIDKYIEN